MRIDISRLRNSGCIRIDGANIRNVKGLEVRRGDGGDEIVLTIKVLPNEFIDFQ